MQVYGTVLSFLAVFGYLYLNEAITNSRGVLNFDLFSIIITAAVVITTVVLHELLHGVGYLIAGGKMQFGVGRVGYMPLAYASTKGSRIPLRHMFISAYLPLIVLSVSFIGLGLTFPNLLLAFTLGFAFNFAGAVADIWLSMQLWRYKNQPGVLVEAIKGGGLDVYVK